MQVLLQKGMGDAKEMTHQAAGDEAADYLREYGIDLEYLRLNQNTGAIEIKTHRGHKVVICVNSTKEPNYVVTLC